jgi:glutamate formiminotransferase/formiminotetrahydrofolate cyclodeaminase
MVANLSAQKRGWDNRWAEFSDWAEKAQNLKDKLLILVDEDTTAFNGIIEAFSLPNGNESERSLRKKAIQKATKYAIEIPFNVMQLASSAMEICNAMVINGNPASATDAGVGALAARSAVLGAFLNVKVNASSLDDKEYVSEILKKGQEITQNIIEEEQKILKLVEDRITAG